MAKFFPQYSLEQQQQKIIVKSLFHQLRPFLMALYIQQYFEKQAFKDQAHQ